MIVLLSWWGGWPWVISLSSDFPSMKANTALGMILLGGALVWMAWQGAEVGRWVVASSVILLGGTTLVQSIWDVDFGIDQALARDPWSPAAPGRMSEATATTFLFCGVLLGAFRMGPERFPLFFDSLFYFALFAPLTALMAYTYSPDSLFEIGPFSTVALHTALGFMLFLSGFALLTEGRSTLRFASLDHLCGQSSCWRGIGLILLPLTLGWLVHKLILAGIIAAPFAIAMGVSSFLIIMMMLWTFGAMHHENAQAALEGEAKQRLNLEHRLLAILDLSGDALLFFGPNNEVLHANKGAEELFGRSAAELKTLSLPDLIPARFRDRHERLVGSFKRAPKMSSTQDNPLNMIALHREGFEIPVTITVSKKSFEGQIYSTAVVRDASSLAERIGSLCHDALVDPLTQIDNRRALDMTLCKYQMGQRKTDRVAVMVLDLDHFKRINDSHGHDEGDKVLTAVAKCIAGCLRDTDRVFRFGGEEFVIISTDITPDDALSLAERVRQSVLDRPPCSQERVTISVGVGFPEPGDGALEQAFKRADQAVYEAKAKGRNCVVAATA
ncbi:GGDEF domain-containing protein [Magnetospira thiophila]